MSRKPIPKAIREQVKMRFGGRCGYCGHLPKVLHIDHIVPHRAHYDPRTGDPDRVENLMPACSGCNLYKTSMPLESFRMMLGEQIRMLRERQINFRLAERFRQVQLTQAPIVFFFERVARSEVGELHGCLTGDCPHEKQSECDQSIQEAFYG